MSLLHIAGGATEDKLMVEDVFSTYLYTGNGSTQTINNGIDLAGKGGMVWVKQRNGTGMNCLFDTTRGVNSVLLSNTTDVGLVGDTALSSFNSNGISLDYLGNFKIDINGTGQSQSSWTFRKAHKFFDIVMYTGNGVAGRQIPHSLGCEVGMVITKRLDLASGFAVLHKDANLLFLNGTDAAYSSAITATRFGDGTNVIRPTDTVFTVGTTGECNISGGTYVAYLYAHDTSADGMIQCGSFTTDGSGNGSYNTGWSNGSQYALIKCSSSTGDWEIYDIKRTPTWTSSDARLIANLSNAEDLVARLSASSGVISFTNLLASQTYIIKTIRGV